MKKGLSNKLVGQTGEYLVCAELGRRGLIATSFTGNVPEFDLIVADDKLTTIPIQVKTSTADSYPTRANLWIDIKIDHKNKQQIDRGNLAIDNPELIYICVSLKKADSTERDRFFVLQKRDLQKICAASYRKWMDSHDWKRPRNYESLDNRYSLKDLEPYEGNWELLYQCLKIS